MHAHRPPCTALLAYAHLVAEQNMLVKLCMYIIIAWLPFSLYASHLCMRRNKWPTVAFSRRTSAFASLGRIPLLARKTQARHCNFRSPFTSQILLTFKDGEVVARFIPQDDSTTGDNNANHREALALLSRRRRRRAPSRTLVGIL